MCSIRFRITNNNIDNDTCDTYTHFFSVQNIKTHTWYWCESLDNGKIEKKKQTKKSRKNISFSSNRKRHQCDSARTNRNVKIVLSYHFRFDIYIGFRHHHHLLFFHVQFYSIHGWCVCYFVGRFSGCYLFGWRERFMFVCFNFFCSVIFLLFLLLLWTIYRLLMFVVSKRIIQFRFSSTALSSSSYQIESPFKVG